MSDVKNHQFKITIATAIIVLIFVIATSVQFATWKTETQSRQDAINLRIDYLNDKCDLIQYKVEKLEDRQDNTDIGMAEIKTKLTNIEALLVEIKADLRE